VATVSDSGITRRTLIAAGAGLAVGSRLAIAATDPAVAKADFSALPDGAGWPAGWSCPGVANLSVSGGRGVLLAGTDVFPSDPRPHVFAVDARFLAGSVRAAITAPGSLAGVLLRRTGPRDYYAAFYDVQQSLLSIVRRSGADQVTLAQTPVAAGNGEVTLELSATGAKPTNLTATLGVFSVTAQDAHPALQRAGDAGVLGQARTLFPSQGPPVLPSLGNFHLLPYGVQEGEEVLATPPGQEVLDEIRRESTVVFREIVVTSAEAPTKTPAAVMAATSGLPRAGGARLHVASDLPAEVVVEVADNAAFAHPRRVAHGRTGAFDAYTVNVRGLPAKRRAYWRATTRRAGITKHGPVRSFPVLPHAGAPDKITLAIASCGAQFGPLFDDIVKLDPDVFVWQGDLNYPDTVGPYAQTMTGYAGIWRDFLANPKLAPVFARSTFVCMRDDHDYAGQDTNSLSIPKLPWGVAPWDALMNPDIGCRFSAGQADVWVLDQRRFKSDPNAPEKADVNNPAKTLLGLRQRNWLMRTLRASKAPFKVICSPCTVFMNANRRDGNWASGFTDERDYLLPFIDHSVSGKTIFVSGDTHLTGVFDKDGWFEARPCPVGIPPPNDITLTDPQAAQHLGERPGVVYADDNCHYAVLEVGGGTLEISLRRDDGTTPYRKSFTAGAPSAARTSRT